MPPPTQCTVTYTAVAVGPINPTALEAAMAAVVLNGDPILEMGFASAVVDTTAPPFGRSVTRTLVYTLAPGFFSSFPDLGVSAFVNLWTTKLSAALNSKVSFTAPVLS